MFKQIYFVLIISYLFVLSPTLNSQTIQNWEKYLEQFEDISEQSQLLEQLEDLLKHPLDLNTASRQEMLMIPGFPESGARKILNAQKKEGKLTSLSQAKELITNDEELWQWLSQFITVRKIKQPLQFQFDSRVRFSRKKEKSLGYLENEYEGNPNKLYQRYRIQIPERLQLATLVEKDPGEIKINDHQVFNLEYNLEQLNTNIIVGNYTINIGMGLMLWSPFTVSKGSAPFYAVRRTERMLRPYLSSYEAEYFQGVAFHYNPGNWEIIGWYSKIKQDARITNYGTISSFYETGLHRSIIEKEKQNRADIELKGGAVGINFSERFHIQVTGMGTNYNPQIEISNSQPENFQLSGNKLQVSGFNFWGSVGYFTLFGETAKQQNFGHAVLVGTKGQWRKTKLLVLYRYYSPKYNNPFAHGFGEWSETKNENGWYLAWQFSLFAKSKITLAADQYSSPWQRFGMTFPQNGSDLYFQLEQNLNRSFSFYFRFNHDNRFTTIRRENLPSYLRELLIPENLNRIRFHFRLNLTDDSEMNGRIETMQYSLNPETNYNLNQIKENGWLLYWDFRKRYSQNFQFSTRVTFFDTPSYDTRLYQFENDLPGILSTKLLYGRGIRFYCLAKWGIFNNISFSAKYASTRYENRTTIGSGWDLIESPVEHYFSIQLDVEM